MLVKQGFDQLWLVVTGSEEFPKFRFTYFSESGRSYEDSPPFQSTAIKRESPGGPQC